MLHPGRTGSTVVADLLARTPGVRWAGEMFEPVGNPDWPRCAADPRAALVASSRRPLQKRSRRKSMRVAWNYRLFGFETKYLPDQHLRADVLNRSIEAYLALLTGLGFERFVLLHRANFLRWLVSGLVGFRTGQWHTQAAPAAPTRLRLDPNAVPLGTGTVPLVAYFQRLEAERARLNAALAGRACLDLCYETDVLPDPQRAYRAICAFAGVAAVSLPVRLERTNPFPLAQIVENYDEVAQALAGTRWAWMLESPDMAASSAPAATARPAAVSPR